MTERNSTELGFIIQLMSAFAIMISQGLLQFLKTLCDLSNQSFDATLLETAAALTIELLLNFTFSPHLCIYMLICELWRMGVCLMLCGRQGSKMTS